VIGIEEYWSKTNIIVDSLGYDINPFTNNCTIVQKKKFVSNSVPMSIITRLPNKEKLEFKNLLFKHEL